MNRWPMMSLVLAVSIVTTCAIPRASAQQSPAGAAPVTAATGGPETPPAAAVFEMKYRGLDTPDDPMTYRSFWGFGTPDDGGADRDPFVKAVKSQVKNCALAYNRSLPKAPWSVVELDEKKEPVALYFDLNADGRLSDNERFPRAAKSNLGYPHVFVTSDFQLRTEDQREIPFRVLLAGHPTGNGDYSFMWSPHCVLEGQTLLAGVPMKLFLTAAGFTGSFTQFGGCSFALVPAGQKLPAYVSRRTLSSLIYHQGAFYHLKLQGTHTKDGTVRVAIEKDTTPTGQVALEVAGKEGLKTRLTGVQLQGAGDATIQLYLNAAQPTLPVGQYRASYGCVSYGLQSNDEWRVDFENGPAFDIKAAETARVNLGQPVLSVKAIDEKDRYTEGVQERSAYAKGTSIYLSPQIKGKAGEVYMRFTQMGAGNNNPTDVKPHVTIRDPDGKTVAWADMEYG